MQMKKQCFSWTAMRTVSRRHQLRLCAEAGASRHTTQYSLVGCFHSALHHGGEAIAPCPTPRAAKKDTSVHLAANPAPLRRIVGFRALTKLKRLTLLRCIEDVCSPIYSEPMPQSMHNQLATSIPLPRDAVINELRRVCNIIAIPHSHNRAPPIQHRNFLWDTVRCNKVEFNQPRFAQDASDDVNRTAIDSIYSSLGAYYFELWTDVSSSLAELAPGSAALLYGSTTTTDLPVEVHRAAAGRLASSYRAECLAIESGIRHLIPFVWEHPNRPHDSWWRRTPCRQLRHSASSHWPCETTSLKRVGLCCSS
ncbi:hypothetical protein TCDM_10164 [Trypanosoma cruzi Dm28c]|uniref:Uncharacterized protein n=2 Tax=Trypanosoma cruzi TaxID=5693 RepID=V5BCR7_TRYCR|nr:hypothetical protein TCDM_10164 [Trypanosoma cruzi Dm28c]PWV01952.1 hypothetical protein C4B63_3g352 [Trypanosoma cruzi]